MGIDTTDDDDEEEEGNGTQHFKQRNVSNTPNVSLHNGQPFENDKLCFKRLKCSMDLLFICTEAPVLWKKTTAVITERAATHGDEESTW